MSKKLVIRLAISLIFIAFVYTLFWFFKLGQLEKRITKFISDNNAYVTSGSIKSYGFPLSQNITIKDITFTIPNPIFSKRQISISELQATSDIFADNFFITLPQGVSTQNDQGEIARVKFNSEPKISVNILDSHRVDFSYEDSGYSMQGPSNKLVLAAKSSKISISINGTDKSDIKVKIDTDIQEIEGFDIVDIYNNILRENIVKGIQTGKIKIGSSQVFKEANPVVEKSVQKIPSEPQDDNSEESKDIETIEKEESGIKEPANPVAIPPSPEVNKENLSAEIKADSTDKLIVSNQELLKPQINDTINEEIEIEQLAQNDDESKQDENMQVIVEESSEEISHEDDDNLSNTENSAEVTEVKAAQVPVEERKQENKELAVIPSASENVQEEDLELKNRYSKGVKSNLKISMQYTLTSNNNSDQLDLPFDPTKIQELPVQYNKEIKINNLELSNQDYQILSNGTLSQVADDTMPSGNLTIIIQNHHNFISYLKDYVKFYLGTKGYNLDPVKMPATEIVANEIELNINAQNIETKADEQTEIEVANSENLETESLIAHIPTQIGEQDEVEIIKEVVEVNKPVETPLVKDLVIKDGYDNFLKKMYDSLSEVSTELSGKNPATTNEESRYEIKREKNLEFKINGTPIREVLGKF